MHGKASDERYQEAFQTLAVAARSRKLDELAVRACGALEEAGIPSLVFRGPAVAHRLYDDPAQRPYQDVDVLVPEAQREPAHGVIAGLGMRPVLEGGADSEQSPHATAFLGDAGSVDL